MSMYNDIAWGEKGSTERCVQNSMAIAKYARRFPRSFLGCGSEKKWCGAYSDKPDGDWDKTAERVMLNFAESGHPIFRATSALEKGSSSCQCVQRHCMWRRRKHRKNVGKQKQLRIMLADSLERRELRSKAEMVKSLFTSTVVKKPLNWFCARLFL